MTWYLIYFRSYMDTEQYDEAVRDYEKIYKMDKNRGETTTFSRDYTVICKFIYEIYEIRIFVFSKKIHVPLTEEVTQTPSPLPVCLTRIYYYAEYVFTIGDW